MKIKKNKFKSNNNNINSNNDNNNSILALVYIQKLSYANTRKHLDVKVLMESKPLMAATRIQIVKQNKKKSKDKSKRPLRVQAIWVSL